MSSFNLSDDIIRTIISKELKSNKHFDMKQNVHNFVNEANVYEHLVKYMKQALEYEFERFTKFYDGIDDLIENIYVGDCNEIINDLDNLLMIITRVSTENDGDTNDGTEKIDNVMNNIIRQLFYLQINICKKIKIILLDVTCKDVANIICDYILTQ